MGFSELLAVRNYGPEKTKELAESVQLQSARLKQIMDDLLDIVSIEQRTVSSLEVIQVSLEHALVGLCDKISGCDNFHYIDLDNQKYWPIVEFEQFKIRKIMVQILNNVYKYSPNNLKIKVSTTIGITD
jgi:K+-sensing histidine kinase KdpD